MRFNLLVELIRQCTWDEARTFPHSKQKVFIHFCFSKCLPPCHFYGANLQSEYHLSAAYYCISLDLTVNASRLA